VSTHVIIIVHILKVDVLYMFKYRMKYVPVRLAVLSCPVFKGVC